jgi:hypothetical protein
VYAFLPADAQRSDNCLRRRCNRRTKNGDCPVFQATADIGRCFIIIGKYFKKNQVLIFLFLVTFINPPFSVTEIDHLTSFSDPARLWGNGVERVIEEAYRLMFRTKIIGDRVMNIRMPFAENNERDILAETGWDFLGSGKGNPAMLWPAIEAILDSRDIADYIAVLSSGQEQVLIFDFPTQIWTSSRDLFDIARMKAGSYRGLPHRPYVLVTGRGPQESDV